MNWFGGTAISAPTSRDRLLFAFDAAGHRFDSSRAAAVPAPPRTFVSVFQEMSSPLECVTEERGGDPAEQDDAFRVLVRGLLDVVAGETSEGVLAADEGEEVLWTQGPRLACLWLMTNTTMPNTASPTLISICAGQRVKALLPLGPSRHLASRFATELLNGSVKSDCPGAPPHCCAPSGAYG